MKSLIILLVLARVAIAGDYTPPAFLAAPPALPAGYDAGAALRLDLTAALQLAMQQNLGMAFERKQVDATRIAVDGASGALYEPVVSAGFTHGSSATPPATSQAGAPGDTVV